MGQKRPKSKIPGIQSLASTRFVLSDEATLLPGSSGEVGIVEGEERLRGGSTVTVTMMVDVMRVDGGCNGICLGQWYIVVVLFGICVGQGFVIFVGVHVVEGGPKSKGPRSGEFLGMPCSSSEPCGSSETSKALGQGRNHDGDDERYQEDRRPPAKKSRYHRSPNGAHKTTLGVPQKKPQWKQDCAANETTSSDGQFRKFIVFDKDDKS